MIITRRKILTLAPTLFSPLTFAKLLSESQGTQRISVENFVNSNSCYLTTTLLCDEESTDFTTSRWINQNIAKRLEDNFLKSGRMIYQDFTYTCGRLRTFRLFRSPMARRDWIQSVVTSQIFDTKLYDLNIRIKSPQGVIYLKQLEEYFSSRLS